MKRGLLLNAIVILLGSVLLTACGGGSGDGSFAGGGGIGGDTGGAGGGATLTPSIAISLVRTNDAGEEVSVDRVDPNNPAIVVATISNVDEDVIVNFTSTLGQFDPASASVLARNGEARITLEAGASAAGAGTVSAEITVDNEDYDSNTIAFEVLEFVQVEEDLRLGTCPVGGDELDCVNNPGAFAAGQIDIDLPDNPAITDGLAPRGRAQVSVVVVDVSSGTAVPEPGVSVVFTSRCTNLELATISEARSDANGVATATYQAAGGCEEEDSITATIPSLDATASGTIFVYRPGATNIIFDSVRDPEGDLIDSIFIKDAGGNSTAQVIFQILDSFGEPIEDVLVTFELTTKIGGLEIEGETTNSLATQNSDSEGRVTAFVNAGFIATTVRVRATISTDVDNNGVIDGTKSTLSEQLSVNTGVADQDSMTIALTASNIEGEDFVGTTTSVSVRLSDQFNNPVSDGTTVQFRTEYGSIVPSCVTSGGVCAVEWTSQDPRRPLDPNASLGAQCPSEIIYDEAITIDGADGDTGYRVLAVGRVETTGDVGLDFGDDYTVDSDGSGITCASASTECTDGANLRITYYRAWLDEDVPNGDTDHTISNPGVATAPFRGTSVPCVTSARAATPEAPAFFGGQGQIYGGRSTVLAFAQGEESFTDTNGNGRYDEGEPFIDLPEAFLDVNEDDVFGNGNPSVDDSSDNTPSDWNCYGPAAPLSTNNPPLNRCYQVGGDEDLLIDFNRNGQFDEGNGIYNGTLCPVDETTGQTPDYCTRDLVNIRTDTVILSAGSFARVRVEANGERITTLDVSGNGPPLAQFTADRDVVRNDGVTLPSNTPFSVGFDDDEVLPGIGDVANLTTSNGGLQVQVSDALNGLMPGGTSITLDAGGVCDIVSGANISVPNSRAYGPFAYSVVMGPADSPQGDLITVAINVTTPIGELTQAGFTCIAQ